MLTKRVYLKARIHECVRVVLFASRDPNKKIPTGEVELLATEVSVLQMPPGSQEAQFVKVCVPL